MILSIGQIQGLLRQAGWPESLIVDAAAVFYFESGRGNTDAHNGGNPPGAEDSWGLAQVNRKAWPQYSVEQLRDPLFNLQVAYMIYQKQNWRAWYNTYYGGRYKQYLSASQAAYGSASSYLQSAAIALQPSSGLVLQGGVGVFLIGLALIIYLRR